MGGGPPVSTIIATKYSGPCLKCGEKIKAGSLVNWDRGHGIWHLDEDDNKRLGSSMIDSRSFKFQMENSRCTNTDQREEKIMGSSNNDDTINLNDLIKALQGMTEKETEVKVAKPPKKEKKQSPIRIGGPTKYWEKKLTNKQVSFCELMALGSSSADAYSNSYDITDTAFSGNAARRLIKQKKIRDKIAEFRNDLAGEDVKGKTDDFEEAIRSEGGKGGWAFRLTKYQEGFCQAMASGSTRIDAFNNSGFVTTNWTDGRIRKEASRLMTLPKIKLRIADLMSGNAPDIETVIAGENSHRTSRSPNKLPDAKSRTAQLVKEKVARESKRGMEVEVPSQQSVISEKQSVVNDEFVNNFVELIKAHGRLFHLAVVTRGQKEVGISGADPEKVEEAVNRSIEVLRETLNEKLS